jgi:hypothetical protein
MEINLIRLTRLPANWKGGDLAGADIGLATFEVEVPLFVWVHFLTHKRLARNASSARAQSPARRLLKGFWTPERWKAKGQHMSPGEALPEILQAELTTRWEQLHDHVAAEVHKMTLLARAAGFQGVANEQINRAFGTSQYMRGVLTGTIAAWESIFALRAHPTADELTQEAARRMQELIAATPAAEATLHAPYSDDPLAPPRSEAWRTAAARIARVSNGAPGPGRRSDLELAQDLLDERHMSPFEHIALWTPYPLRSALYSSPDDGVTVGGVPYGWTNYRAMLENDPDIHA